MCTAVSDSVYMLNEYLINDDDPPNRAQNIRAVGYQAGKNPHKPNLTGFLGDTSDQEGGSQDHRAGASLDQEARNRGTVRVS